MAHNPVRFSLRGNRSGLSMAGSRAVWGIDLGQCALKAVKLSYDVKEDRAVAVAFDYVEHPKILSQPDADPEELIKSAFDQFLSRNNVKDDLLYVSVPGQAGLARFVKLPPVETKKIPDIVQFEARQQIPFPMNEIVWDFQKIGGGEETEGFALETEVAIFAIKKDMVQRILAPYKARGLDVEVVQFAPVAIYNFAAYDYFYHGNKLLEAQAKAAGKEEVEGGFEEGDVVVLLDVGADKTDVVVTDGDKIWLRNLPIGGNHFTRALTKDLKLTFAKAEHLKRNATKAPDPKRLYQAMRPVFQDFVNELQRSVSYYLSTHRGANVKKIIGVGNGFKLNGMQKFLQQSLQYEVERIEEFRGMRGDEVIASPVFAENMLGFCVPYGLALQGLKQTPIQTNLLPKEVALERVIRAKKPWSLSAAVALLMGFTIYFLFHWMALQSVTAKTFDNPKNSAKTATGNFQKLQTDYEGAVGKFKQNVTNGENLIGADRYKRKLGWIKVFRTINEALPRRAMTDENTDVEQLKEINVDFIDAMFMANTGDWFGKLNEDLKNSTMAAADKGAAPSGEGWVFQLCGYTHNIQHENFLAQEILPRFQTEEMRKKGITHAVLAQAEFQKKWTPRLGSKVASLRGEFGKASASFGTGGGAGGMNMGGGRGGMAMGGGGMDSGGMNSGGDRDESGGGGGGVMGGGGRGSMMMGNGGGAMGGMMMGGGRGGMAMGGGRGGEGDSGGMEGMPGDWQQFMQQNSGDVLDDKSLVRCEFVIQFLWKPGDEAAPAAGAAAPPPK
jgi:type IV pilus assembly protein PilM